MVSNLNIFSPRSEEKVKTKAEKRALWELENPGFPFPTERNRIHTVKLTNEQKRERWKRKHPGENQPPPPPEEI